MAKTQYSEKNYKELYEKITRPFAGHPARIWLLRTLNRTLVMVMYIVYPLLLWWVYTWTRSVLDPLFLKMLLVPALSFAVVSIFRHRLNRPRPYEIHRITPLIPRNKHGESMPSRHVFSAAMISMCWLYVNPKLGVLFLLLSLLSGVTRVLGGVHYPSDVAIGFDIGVLCGILLWIV